jgi:hypothetical protein
MLRTKYFFSQPVGHKFAGHEKRWPALQQVHSRAGCVLAALAAGLLGFAGNAAAQAAPFTITAQVGSGLQALNNGASINLAASAVGQSVQLTLTFTYTGAGSASLGDPQIAGSPAFSAFSSGSTEVTTGVPATYIVVFKAPSSSQVSAFLTVPYVLNTGQAIVNGNLSFGLTGTAPGFTFGYAIQPQGNAVPISDGSSITYPQTQVGSTVTALLTILNSGTAPGVLNSVIVTGSAFSTVGLPLLPGTINASQALQLSVIYAPKAISSDTGTIQLVFGGQTITFNLAGSGISSQLDFQFNVGSQSLPVNQNQVTLPDTQVGTASTVSVTVTDTGNANSVINGISISGAGFQLATVPPLPQTIIPGGSLGLTFKFTPTAAGQATGFLVIGGVTLTITGNGLAPLYQYSFAAGTATTLVAAGGTVFFSPTPVGLTAATTFTVTNNGTAQGTISAIFIGEANSPFSLTGIPPLPITLAPNQAVSFGVTFAPSIVGSLSGTLHLDAAVFTLNGSGSPPAAFPGFTLTGPQGTLGPLQQPAIGLSLAASYPLAVQGTLTMQVIPDGFSADPAIQFSTTGRTVNFTIPANSTTATFANGSTSIALQTGSTSGTIILSPTFQTAAGVTLTPATSSNLQLVVPPAAPVLLGGQVTAQTAASITLAITGVADTQALSHMDFTFTGATGFNLTGSTVPIDLTGISGTWFRSAAAQPFGGQFVVTIPFSFAGPAGVTSPANAVTSVSITVTNALGTSAPVTVALP